MHILVVEDEQKMAKALQEGLEADSYSVLVAHTGEEGFYLVQAQPFDLGVRMLCCPDTTALRFCPRSDGAEFGHPVLLLTSRDAIEDRVRGLDAGADDYLVKPFAFPRSCWRGFASC